MASADTDRLRDLIRRSRQLDRRIVELQATISELQRRVDTTAVPRKRRRAAVQGRARA